MKKEIVLSALPSDELCWEKELAIAKERNKKIDWFIDLGIDSTSCPLTDERVFQQRVMALTLFVKDVWTKFQPVTDRLILASTNLYREIDPRDECEWDFELEEPLRSRLKAMELFSEYLHRLASYLPDELLVAVRIDVRAAEKKSDIAILLSKERFRHMALEIVGWAPDRNSPVAIVIPEDHACSSGSINGLEEVLAWAEEKYERFRVIPEALLNEEWDGVDSLVFYAPATTLLGKRKAQGFAASGGKIVSYGGTVGIEGEERVG
jgi:hypothetical protein